MFDLAHPETHLDFWIGKWTCRWQDNHGTNEVEKILGGKVVQENFDGHPSAPFLGKSWSVYAPKLGGWRQTWVDDQGNYWNFVGRVDGERFIFATEDITPKGDAVHLRMVFYDIEADTFKWDWERSDDEGETWKLAWQLHYTRNQ